MPDEKPNVKDIFCQALEKTSPEEQAAFLDQACLGDPQVRQRVEALLQAERKAGKFLAGAEPETTLAPDSPLAEGPGTVIGKYKLLQEVGEGGFGVVFMAEQQQPVRRFVALKIIKPGMDSRAVLARFEAERQALALMDHPNIAHVFDGGVTDSGRPYFVMELVKGVPITSFCDKNNSPTDERLRLFVDVCRAVQHAHQKGIIHRDLKPSNIMVTLHDGVPVAKVIDFGVAKALSQRLTEKTLFTAYGQLIGTPLYMSPEQAEMSGLDVDTRSDIYSLGVLLYELLTGCTPLEAEELRDAGYAEMQRIIRETEPPRPSVRLSTSGQRLTEIARHRSIDPKGLRQLVSGELDWIVMKALEKDRRRRYETATAFAVDVERFLRKEPVEAAPPTAGYRLRKFVARRKALFVTVTTVAVALLGGIVGTSGGMFWALGERGKAKEAANAAELARTGAVKSLEREAKARRAAEASELEIERQLYISDMCAAERAWDQNNLALVESLLGRYKSGSGKEHHRGWEWYYLWRLWHRNGKLDTSFPVSVWRSALSADGKILALASFEGAFVTLWDLSFSPPRRTGEFGKLEPDRTGCPTFVALSPNGRLLAYPDQEFKTLIVEDVVTRSQKTFRFGDGVFLNQAVFSPEGDVLVASTTDSRLIVCDPTNGEIRVACTGHKNKILAIAFFLKQKLVVSGDYDGQLLIWSTESGKVRKTLSLPGSTVLGVAISHDDQRIACACKERKVTIWDWDSEKPTQTLDGFRDEVRTVAFSPDDSLLAAGGREGLVRLWNANSLEELEPIRGYRSTWSLQFLPGRRLTFQRSSDTQSVFRIGDRAGDCASGIGGLVATVRCVFWDNQLILAAHTGYNSLDSTSSPAHRPDPASTIRIWRMDSEALHESEPIQPGVLIGCLAASSKRVFATGDARNKNVLVFRDSDKSLLDVSKVRDAAITCGAAFSPDGSRLAVGFSNGQVAVWTCDGQISAWKTVQVWDAHDAAVTHLAFHPTDPSRLATAGREKCVKIWVCDTAGVVKSREHEALQGRRPWTTSLAFSPTGGQIAFSGGSASEIHVWDSKSDRHQILTGHRFGVESLVFLHDGRTLISGSGDSSIRVWDLGAGRERFTIRAGTEIISSMAFSPDEMVIAAGTRGGNIRLFRRATDEEVRSAGW